MAIISMQRTPKGYVEYWVIGRIDIDNFSKVATIKILGFADKTFADELNAVPLESLEITVYPDRFDEYFSGGDFIKNAYRIFQENQIEGLAGQGRSYDFRNAEREPKVKDLESKVKELESDCTE